MNPLPFNMCQVSPGAVDTPIYDGLGEEAKQYFLRDFALRTPMMRHAQAIEIATTISFLLSSESSYITGIDLKILSIMVFSSTWYFRKWSNISQYESSGFPRFFLLDVHSSNIPQKKSWKPRSLKSRHIWPFTKRPCRRKHHDSK